MSGHRPPTTAQAVVASLVLPAESPQAAAHAASPPSLPGLHLLPRDTSMLYDIGRVDSSGRVASSDIISALDWRPGSRLSVTVTSLAIVIRAAPDGPFTVPQRPCIIIPARARQPHAIKPRDLVLIAAAPDFGLVMVYPLSALDEMITSYHTAREKAE